MEIVWDISNSCNLHCKHCGEWDILNSSEALTTKDRLMIAKNLSGIATGVTLIGGEPFLTASIVEIVEIFNERNVEVRFITNGQIHNSQIDRILEKRNVKDILISIDGVEQDNDAVRGEGTWKRAIDFLKKVITKKIDRYIGVSFVLTKKSIRHLDEFMIYMNTLNIDGLHFNLLDLSGKAFENKEDLFLSDEEILDTLIKVSAWNRKVSYKIHIDIGSVDVEKYLRNTSGFLNNVPQKNCRALIDSGFCDMNGYFYPCRKYCGVGIDLKRKVYWEEEYGCFEKFLDKVLCSTGDVSYTEESWCPLGRKENTLAALARERLSYIKTPNYTVKQQIIFHNAKDRFFVIFCKTNEYVEFTVEGKLIYEKLVGGMDTIKIAEQLNYPLKVVWDFLDYEYLKGRIDIKLISQ